MRNVILTSGPRGAGKTTFCKQIVQDRPEVVLLERDAILIELFGTAVLPEYSNVHYIGAQEIKRRIKEGLEPDPVTLIVDLWNGSEDDRINITTHLRDYGAHHIAAWYFVNPLVMVLRQFLARENEGKDKRWQNNMREFMACECSNDFRLYHSRPITLDQGFDAVRVVNPAQGALVPYADLLLPQ